MFIQLWITYKATIDSGLALDAHPRGANFQRQLYYSGQKWAFWGRIRWGRFFHRSLWPYQLHNFKKIGAKWEIWILSYHWYPMSLCRSSGLDTTVLQSWAFFRKNPKHWKLHLRHKHRKLVFGILFIKMLSFEERLRFIHETNCK